METAPISRRRLGNVQEQRALRYLGRQGLRLVEANFHCRVGEIDLIMQDRQGCVVFVEVRYRKSNLFGGAAASVGPAKQRKLRLAAAFFLKARNWQQKFCRFDVVAITGGGRSQADSIEWIQDAFHGC